MHQLVYDHEIVAVTRYAEFLRTRIRTSRHIQFRNQPLGECDLIRRPFHGQRCVRIVDRQLLNLPYRA